MLWSVVTVRCRRPALWNPTVPTCSLLPSLGGYPLCCHPSAGCNFYIVIKEIIWGLLCQWSHELVLVWPFELWTIVVCALKMGLKLSFASQGNTGGKGPVSVMTFWTLHFGLFEDFLPENPGNWGPCFCYDFLDVLNFGLFEDFLPELKLYLCKMEKLVSKIYVF